MKERPTSITIIAWILIIMGLISLVTCTVSLNNPKVRELMERSLLPIPVQYVMTYVGLLVSIISGIGLLKGQNWARFLYVIWGAAAFLVGFLTSPMKLAIIPGFLLFIVIVLFLFRKMANHYFIGSEVTSGTESD